MFFLEELTNIICTELQSKDFTYENDVIIMTLTFDLLNVE